MVRHIGDKLREERGATLLMALFALLIASLVCIVILGASVTTVKQAKSTQQQEQDTLLLQSAAELVGDDFRDVVVKKTIHVTVQKDANNNLSATEGEPSFTAESCMASNEFAATAGSAITSGTNPESIPSLGAFTVTVSLPSDYDNGLDLKSVVKVDYIIRNESYNRDDQVGMNRQVIFTFKLMDNTAPDKVVQQMHLKMTFDKEKSEIINDNRDSDGVGSYDRVTAYTWKKPEFYTGEGAS